MFKEKLTPTLYKLCQKIERRLSNWFYEAIVILISQPDKNNINKYIHKYMQNYRSITLLNVEVNIFNNAEFSEIYIKTKWDLF